MNFNINVTWKYGSKHFFGFDDLSNSDDILFICIVRDPYTWLNSLYRKPFHLPHKLRNNIDCFLENEFYSLHDNFPSPNADEKTERMNDRNMYTKERYNNIFEMRHTKLKYLIEDLPSKVKHYIFIKYEDFITNFEETMNKIRDCGLEVKDNIEFPLNTTQYKKEIGKTYVPNNNNPISKERIYENKNFDPYYEKLLGYI